MASKNQHPNIPFQWQLRVILGEIGFLPNSWTKLFYYSLIIEYGKNNISIGQSVQLTLPGLDDKEVRHK